MLGAPLLGPEENHAVPRAAMLSLALTVSQDHTAPLVLGSRVTIRLIFLLQNVPDSFAALAECSGVVAAACSTEAIQYYF